MIIEFEYWTNTPDGYDNRYIKIEGKSREECLEKAKKETPLGSKCFKPQPE